MNIRIKHRNRQNLERAVITILLIASILFVTYQEHKDLELQVELTRLNNIR